MVIERIRYTAGRRMHVVFLPQLANIYSANKDTQTHARAHTCTHTYTHIHTRTLTQTHTNCTRVNSRNESRQQPWPVATTLLVARHSLAREFLQLKLVSALHSGSRS